MNLHILNIHKSRVSYCKALITLKHIILFIIVVKIKLLKKGILNIKLKIPETNDNSARKS